jgi:hypothetical protein
MKVLLLLFLTSGLFADDLFEVERPDYNLDIRGRKITENVVSKDMESVVKYYKDKKIHIYRIINYGSVVILKKEEK